MTTAADGRQKICPPATVLLYFRARWHFQNADGHTFAGKSRPAEAI